MYIAIPILCVLPSPLLRTRLSLVPACWRETCARSASLRGLARALAHLWRARSSPPPQPTAGRASPVCLAHDVENENDENGRMENALREGFAPLLYLIRVKIPISKLFFACIDEFL